MSDQVNGLASCTEVASTEETSAADLCMSAGAPMTAEDTEETFVCLCVKWEGAQLAPNKRTSKLQLFLQAQLNSHKAGGECSVTTVSEDGKALMSIKPASAISVFQELTGQTVPWKDTSYKIISVDRTLREPLPQNATGDEADVPSSLPSAAECAEVEEQSGASLVEGEKTCEVSVPSSHFWYVNQVYRQEMRRIEEENGVQIVPETKVSFRANQGGNPNKACSDFTSLVQRCLGESTYDRFPLKSLSPIKWKDILKIIQGHEAWFLLSVTPEDIAICGPRQTRDPLSKILNSTQKTLTQNSLAEESAWASQNRPQIGMNIEDPLVHDGLSMDERHWKRISGSLRQELHTIEAKYGVNLKESGITQGKITIKISHAGGLGAASMKSHAVRALLHLYQKSLMSNRSFTNLDPDQHKGAAEKLEESNSKDDAGVGASGSSGTQVSWFSQQSQSDMNNTEAPTGGGATAGESKEEACPICFEPFTDKKRLKCTHEFCHRCLTRSIESMGQVCPICRSVFGKIQGDQPDGTMSWKRSSFSLPGFPSCNTIVINYYIPDGIQTKKHPHPGKRYSGTMRMAYLPDNKEGNEVLHLLQKAFEQKMMFTVGTSITTGAEDQVTWNDIHHKTNTGGGPACYGYPDDDYLKRVKDELKAKGIE